MVPDGGTDKWTAPKLSYEDFPPEKIHAKFCKLLIGANKYSSNLACKSEVGRYPLAISATLLSIKYWMHINDDEIPKSTK